MAGVLIYGNPLFGSINPATWLGGSLASGKTVINSAWRNGEFPSNQAAHDGMMELYRLIVANPGSSGAKTFVLGHSGFSQVINKLLREKSADLTTAGVSASNIEFYKTGDPEQKFTGASVLYPAQSPAIYPGNTAHVAGCPTPSGNHGGYGVGYGLPATCPWTVKVIANQYDGWADAPSDPSNAEMTKLVGFFQTNWNHNPLCYMKSTNGPHGNYPKSHLGSGVVSYVDPAQPTVTYYWIRSYPITSARPISWLSFWARLVDQQRRPTAEAAYTRPVTVPAVSYAAVPSFYWLP